MCGIFCCISHTPEAHSCIKDFNLVKLLENRGPNAKKIKQYDHITFGGFVLWHQGTEMIDQPIESETHALLFNGDMFNNLDCKASETADTKWIFNQFSAAENEHRLINCFKDIEGPYSIIFYDKLKKSIYFARDSLGRNSLLIENNNHHFRLLSTSYKNKDENNTMELPPLGIYKFCNNDFQNCILYPWQLLDKDSNRQLEQLEKCNIRVNVCSENCWANYNLSHTKYDYNFSNMISPNFSSTSELYKNLLNDTMIFKAITEFAELLEDSVKRRVQYTAKFCTLCLESQYACNHSKVAVLFSGGIDCSVLAVLCDRFVSKSDSIDLINVAFENSSSTSNGWNVPDRITANASYENLKKICPERKWNFIKVNVSKEELHKKLTNHIKHLIYPLNTVLDESIGCAFWFASRALGVKDDQSCVSSARVVILGSGADELFGGYVRHRNAYNRCKGTEAEKQQNLLMELEKDWSRIPSRNLARDDRVISDNGRTPRAPFIEEHVVRFIRSLLPSQRCCFLLDDGIGDKLFLRLYGYYLGLNNAAFLKKRAIQFGSRIANKKQSAADRSKYL